MPCYHPLIGVDYGFKDGKRNIKILPEGAISSDAFSNRRCFDIPCGHCIGCRKAQAKEWSERLILENQYHKTAHFVTLSYCNEYLPYSFNEDTGEIIETLKKQDVQKFLKRLRKYVEPDKIRYYLCGEYGDKTHRPHYHAIIFGLPEEKFTFIPDGRSETGNPYFRSTELEKLWSDPDQPPHMNSQAKKLGLNDSMLGFVSIEPANENTMRYVAAYVTKKLGAYSNLYYKERGQVAPFSISSRKPGIGYQYLIEHPEAASAEQIVLGLDSGRVVMKPSRYFRKKWRELDPEKFFEKSDKNIAKSADKLNAKLSVTDDGWKEINQKEEQFLQSRQVQRKGL